MNNTLPACEKACDCCGRVHRNLILIEGGFWTGKSCAQAVQLFRHYPDANAVVWRGYQNKHAQIAAMLGLATSVATTTAVIDTRSMTPEQAKEATKEPGRFIINERGYRPAYTRHGVTTSAEMNEGERVAFKAENPDAAFIVFYSFGADAFYLAN